MIKITHAGQCCGCSSCVQICPKQSITFVEDMEGFLYPQINTSTCSNCGLCEKVCPVLNQAEETSPSKVYLGKHPDDFIRVQSSSGGLFSLFAEQIIELGGVVFGARFNEAWEVIHDYTETKEGLAEFRGSKYVQSVIGESYKHVKTFLNSGRKVLFTGTPCQVAGLKRFLQKEHENLLTIDFICHGVPSPLAWRKFLKEEIDHYNTAGTNTSVLTGVNFRSKSTGWKNFSVVFNYSRESNNVKQIIEHSSVFTDNHYMDVFLSNLTLRPSCYQCPSKSGKSGSDITIGDFWGIESLLPEYDDDQGLSLVFVNNEYKIIPNVGLIHEVAYRDAIKNNSSAENSACKHPYRKLFMKLLSKYSFAKSYFYLTSNNLLCRIVRKLFSYI